MTDEKNRRRRLGNISEKNKDSLKRMRRYRGEKKTGKEKNEEKRVKKSRKAENE